MTPLFGKGHEPDDRPSTAELVGAIILVLVVGFTYWVISILASPLAP